MALSLSSKAKRSWKNLTNIAMLIVKDDKKVEEAMNKALDASLADGLTRSMAKYFPFSIY